jgi:4-amino-4-deoxy-L-arabinose transferase-like glycosyltransferase
MPVTSSSSAPSQPPQAPRDEAREAATHAAHAHARRGGVRLPAGLARPPLPTPAELPAFARALAPALWWYAALPIIIFYAALAPRLSLARSLDLVTDESVYIPTGAVDVTLLQLHDLTNPAWLINYEAPALPKLIIGLGTLYGARHAGHLSDWLYGARVPGVMLSALTLVAFYLLIGPIFGRRAAALGALALAVSPWLAFFGALAYLDIYLMCFMALAAPLIWYAARRPWLYPLAGVLAGLAFASKYTAVALLLPAAFYLYYYYRVVARSRPPKRLLLLPVAAALTFYITDPAIWLNPITRLWDSMLFQVNHASTGHDVFWNGAVWEHVPAGIGIFILLAKLSLLLTIPAVVTLVWAAVRLWRRARARMPANALDDRSTFALTWLVGLLVPFAALPIIVGSHYMLPLAPPIAAIAAWGLILSADALAARAQDRLAALAARPALETAARRIGFARIPAHRRARLAVMAALTALVAVALIAPPAHGLATTHQAEGYTAEWLNGENNALQVAYPGYADGVAWVVAHSSGRTTVTLVSTRGGLDFWRDTRQRAFPQRIRFAFGTPDNFPHSEYIIWPEHLVQRQFPLPANFQSLIVARIQGGATTYCYVLRWPNPNR